LLKIENPISIESKEDLQHVRVISDFAKVLVPGSFRSNWDFNLGKLYQPFRPILEGQFLLANAKLESFVWDVKVAARDFMLKLRYYAGHRGVLSLRGREL